MNVYLTTTDKKHNSTEIPTFTGTALNCILKEGSSVINPTLIFERANIGHRYNYVYIPDFDRYYFVDDIVYQNARIIYYCSVDVLASYKATIGAYSGYVLRSAYTYNEYVIDQYYPVTTRLRQYSQDLGRPWLEYNSGGFWVLGIVNKSGVDYYAFNRTQLDNFMAYLWGDQFILDILRITQLDLSLNPSLKAAADPISYLTCCVWMPFSIYSDEYQTIPFFPATTVKIGGVQTSYAAYGVTFDNPQGADGTGIMIPAGHTYLPDLMPHPQSNERGEYLNSPGFTDCRLVMPPFGQFEYNAAELNQYDRLQARISVDCTNGIGKLQVFGQKLTGTNQYSTVTVLTDVQAQVGIPLPITQIITPGLNVIDMSVKLGASVASAYVGNVGGAISAGSAAVDSFYNARVPRASNVGSRGNLAAIVGRAYFEYTWKYVTDDDNADHGRPLCEVWQLSQLPGYQMLLEPHVHTSGTTEEDDRINSFLSGGYFYE